MDVNMAVRIRKSAINFRRRAMAVIDLLLLTALSYILAFQIIILFYDNCYFVL